MGTALAFAGRSIRERERGREGGREGGREREREREREHALWARAR